MVAAEMDGVAAVEMGRIEIRDGNKLCVECVECRPETR